MSQQATSRVLTLVFTDLAGSVELRRRVGDVPAAGLIAAHTELVRAISAEHGGRVIVSAGDGFFLAFDTPSAGVEFGLRLQRAHAADVSLPKVRIGIHLGEVTERDRRSGRAPEITGFAVDLASRIQSLALPRQVLLSNAVFDNAHQRLKGSAQDLPVEWRAHGQYLFKGFDQPVGIYEAGIRNLSPLTPPTDSDKAHRHARSEEETLPGWRPAHGQDVPGRTHWQLEKKLGAGGFGEAWLAAHKKTRETRVFKFCYSAERLRALKREVTLFRLLKETLGDRPDIARIIDWQFDEAPFYIEMETVAGKPLDEWAEEQGGLDAIPLSRRLGVVARVADAVGAAHSVGILHKDIKPSNILVHQDNPDAPLVTMIDFGIGMLADRDALARKGITALGLTEQSLAEDLALSGTRLYMAPELLEAKPLTTRSDIYSLGVVLFQVAVGDFSRTVATGWEREISDPLLCDDISHCVDGDPTRRIAAAEDLAVRLRSLDQRRLEAEEEARRQAAEEHSRRRARRLMGYCLAGVAIAAVASLMALTEWQNAVSESRFRLEAESARADAERHREIAVEARRRAEVEQYTASIHAAEARLNEQRIEKVLDTLLNRTPEYLRNWEWGWLLTQTAPEDMAIARQNLTHAAFSPDGKRFVTSDLSGYVTIRDCTTGRRLLSSHPHEKGIWSTIFSPDGRQILTTSWDRQACILDAATGQTCFTLKGHGDIVRGAAFSPDGRFAVTTGRADRTARIWDTGTGTGILTITDPGEGFYVADYSSDGKRVATGSLGGAVRIWNAATGAVQVELTTHPATVTGIAFHPGGERLVTACKDGKARIFDAVSGGLFREIASPKSTMGYCAWSPDGNMIGTAEDDGACRLWDPASGRLLLALQADDPMWKLDFSPDSKRILTTSRRSVRLWNLDRLRAKSVIVKNDESETTMPVDTLRVAGFPPERDPTWNSLDRVWNTTAGATMIEAGGRHFRVDSRYAAFSPDRSLSIHFDKPTSYSATVMDCRSGKPVRNLGPDAVYDADFSPDGTCAAVMRFSGPIVLFNASDWSVMRTFETGNVRNWAVRFSPDGRRLAGAGGDLESGGHVTVWDVASGRKEVALSSSRDDQAFSLAFSPDCRLLAAGYADDRVRVWDLADKKAKWTLAGHSRPVIAVGFSPDCKRLVTASIDNTVKIWGLDGGRELVTAISTTGKSSLLGAGFSGDGEAVCAVTSDGTMQVAEAFPWDDRIDPTLASVPIDERLELWKRRHRLLPTIGPDDLK